MRGPWGRFAASVSHPTDWIGCLVGAVGLPVTVFLAVGEDAGLLVGLGGLVHVPDADYGTLAALGAAAGMLTTKLVRWVSTTSRLHRRIARIRTTLRALEDTVLEQQLDQLAEAWRSGDIPTDRVEAALDALVLASLKGPHRVTRSLAAARSA